MGKILKTSFLKCTVVILYIFKKHIKSYLVISFKNTALSNQISLTFIIIFFPWHFIHLDQSFLFKAKLTNIMGKQMYRT